MWGALQHPRHFQFYEEFHAGRSEAGEDWQPMVNAVRYLQAHRDASLLFAFTSLMHFHVTTGPTYAECEGHPYVRITWSYSDRVFRLSFGSCNAGWVDVPSCDICDEQSFPTAVEPLLQRLFQPTSSNAIARNA